MPAKKESTVSKDSATREVKSSKDPSTNESKASPPEPYELNAKVLCRHVDTLYYEAKIINVDHTESGEPVYTVHYQGWNQRHDEKIPHSVTLDRFQPYTPANVERAKAEMRDAQARSSARKRNRKVVLENDKKNDSRANTPLGKCAGASSRAESTTSEKAHGSANRKKKTVEMKPVQPVVQKREIKIEIPSTLKEVLVDDNDIINRQMMLVRLPARITVDKIIDEYAKDLKLLLEKGKNKNQGLATAGNSAEDEELKLATSLAIENSLGIKDYFNATLHTQLLYKFEKLQYDKLLENLAKKTERDEEESEQKEVTKKKDAGETIASSEEEDLDDFVPSQFYGFIHLLRLFVRLGRLLSVTDWGSHAERMLVNNAHKFLKYMEINRHRFLDFQTDYEVPSSDYQRHACS